MDRDYTILIVARDEGAWTELAYVLADRNGYRVLAATTVSDAQQLIRDVHIDLVVADEGTKDFDGCAFLSNLRISNPDIVRVLVLTKTVSRQSKAFKEASVYQYVRKPLEVEQIALIVKRGLESRELARRHRLISREFKMSDDSIAYHPPHDLRLSREGQQFEKLVYVSEKMAAICEMAKTAAKTDLPILIQGETGTGKELLARAIHYNSSRKSSPLLMQNCGGMIDELL
ncbi:MAG: sigma 54-interacting transcriptional regulator, partial [Proteobacteria bacterium]|nr:sigma 54-interacting transcriptional regulator [Pseudomonadota bacterium]